MNYAVMISSNEINGWKQQVAVVPTGDEIAVFARRTNGGRGPSNAWTRARGESINNMIECWQDQTLGEPVAVMISAGDLSDIASEEGLPKTLFFKLNRKHELATNEINDITIGDLLKHVLEIADANVNDLAKWHVDGRAQRDRKKQEATAPAPVQAVVQVVKQAVAPIANAVLAFIPSADLVKGYITRKFFGVDEVEIYDKALERGANVLLEGPAGTGKTSSAMHYAWKRQKRFYSLSGNIALEPSQIFGKYVPDGNGGFVWVDGGLTEIVRNGGVLLLNEINFMPARISTVLFSLLDYRREITLLDHAGEVIKAHPDLLIIADMNPSYRGTSPLNEAFRDRFAISLQFDYDSKVESKIIKSSTLLQVANNLRDLKKAGDTPVSTRLLKNFEQQANDFNIEFAIESFVNSFLNVDNIRESLRMVLEGEKYSIAKELGLKAEIIASPTAGADDNLAEWEKELLGK